MRACERQVRIAPAGGVVGLDFGAILAFAAARGAASELLTDVLAEIEPMVAAHYAPDGAASDAEDESP